MDEKPVVEEEAEKSFEDINAEAAKMAETGGLTNDDKGSNIEPEKKPEQIKEEPASQIPESWYIEGVPRSLKTLDDYHQWVVGMNNLRGKQSAEVEAVRREMAEMRGAMGERQRQPEAEVDIEGEWQPHLAERPVHAIAEITKRVIDSVLKSEFGNFRKDYDERLSKHDGFLQEQEIKNARSGFLERAKLSDGDEKRIAGIISERADKYKREYTDDKGKFDMNGVLADAYERFKAQKYDEMQNGIKEDTQKKEQSKTRAVVAPGTGKPPMQEIEDIDKMSMEELEKKIQRTF